MRFSDFLLVSDPTDLNFIVGYTDEQNIRINVLDLFTGQIIGSGTAGYVPLFTAANVIDDSVIFQHGSNIVIGGVDSLGYKLAVSGSLYSSNGAVINSTVSGADALRVIGGDGDIFVIPNDLGQPISSLRRIIHPPAILTTESATLGQLNTAISNLEEDIEILLDLKVDKSSVGEPNGVASLDATGKIPLSEIPDSIIGQVEYMGTWNAFTNTPTLNPLIPEEKGHYYVVSAAGVFGGVDYAVGDWIISNGVEWQKVDNTDAVTSVFGRIGAILALEADYQSFYPRLSQAYDNPTWINSLAFTKITGVPPFLLENQTITLSGDVTGSGKTSISTTISNNAVSNEKLRDSVGTSVIGRAANSTGDPADIQASTDGHVLLRSAGNLLFGLISSDSISSINWSKITGTPTTLSGYGITDAYTKTEADNKFVPYTGANANVNLGSNNITANSFIKAGGTSSQFLKADGSVDTSQYVPTTRSVNAGTGLTGGGNLSSDVTISFDTTWGDTRYAYRTRQLTINGTTFDLSADRTWNVGTVTSVGLSAPTGFAVSNSPVTSSGTLALSFALGYSLPTNAVQANWTTAYNDSIISAAVTGTATKTLTLNQQDGGTITASWSDIDTAPVTSVFGRLGDVVAQSGDYNTSQVTESGNLYFTNARSRSAVSLTTTGTSGVATYDTGTGVFNIPNYGSALTGYVPYTGANQTVNLNTQQLQAGHATFTTNGSTDTLTINHTSGSGRGIVVTKSGSGEGLTVVKSSGSGNVASITGGITLLTTLNLTNALADTYIASAANWNTAYNNRITSLTTTGTSGVATLISHVLNIPQYQAQGNYITQLSGEATASGPGNATVTLTNSAVTGKILTGLTVAGSSIASTDSILTAFGKLQGQVNDLIGGLQYQGTWNAFTNTPAITSGVGTDGHFYIVSVAGNTTIDGVSGWQVGDWIVFHSPVWQKVDNTESVVSVNGLTGAVTLTTSNITEGTNLYFTNARARTAISLTTTGNSGASNYDNGTGVLNVPQYSLAGLGGVPTTRALTINGINFDLSADRTWSVGTVTNIATSGPITGGPITGTGTIGITQASSTSDGFLSSTDWNTFNGKQNALTNPVTGTGNTNYLSKFTSNGSTIGNSIVFDNGTNVGIGTATPASNSRLTIAPVISTFNIELQQPGVGGLNWQIGSTNNDFNAGGGRLVFTYDNNSANSILTLVQATSEVLIGTNTPNGNKLRVNGNIFSDGVIASVGNINVGSQLTFTPAESRIISGTGSFAINDNANSRNQLHILNSTGAATFFSTVTATQFIRSGGTSSQFLKADGSVDSNTYYLASNPSAFIALTALSGTAPIQYNNTTGAISITQSSGSTNGFLSSTDWNTFNNKTSNVGTVTSVAALTLGTSGTDLSSTVANGTTTPVITLNVPTASASNRGALSAADWTTFNNKQNALTNPVTGTGDANYLPRFTGASTIGNSQVFDNGTNVGINQAIPTRTLDILGASGIGTVLKLQGASGTTTYLQLAYNGATNAQSGYIGYNSSSQLQFFTNDTLALTIDSSRNLGLGVTPSAWGGGISSAIEGRNGSGIAFGFSNLPVVYFTSNAYFNGTNWIYNLSRNSAMYHLNNNDGSHLWYTAPSGTAGNAISFTQAMTLGTNSGLSIGTPSAAPAQGLLVQGASTLTGNLTLNSRLLYSGTRTANINSDGSILYIGENNVSNILNVDLVNQRVGIGTTSPDRLLTLAPSSGDAYINLRRPIGASTQSTLEFNTAGTNDWLIRTDDTSANLKFYSYGFNNYALILTRSSGAATFSSSVTSENLFRSNAGIYQIFQGGTFRGGLYNYAAASGSGTDYSPTLTSETDLHFTTGGSVTKKLTITSTGAATFSSSVTEAVATFKTTSNNYGSVFFRIDSTEPTSRNWGFFWDYANYGELRIAPSSTNTGNPDANLAALRLARTGEATFSSSVNVGGLNISGAIGGGPSLIAVFKPSNPSSVNSGYQFQLNPAGGAYGGFSVTNVDPGINQTLLQLAAQNLSGDSYINVPATAQNISLRVANTPYFYLQGSTGNIVIGTTTPNGNTLRVGGTIWADSTITYWTGFTSYTPDGLFSASAVPGRIYTPSGGDRILFGYFDQGGGQYWGRIGFKGNTNWSLGTGAGGNSFVIGVNNGATGNLVIDNAGAATFSSSVNTGGNVNVGGQLTFTPAESRLISGSSSFAVNNNDNTENQFRIVNSTGAATFRSGIATSGYTASSSYAAIFNGAVGIGTNVPSTNNNLTLSSSTGFNLELINPDTGGVTWQIGATNNDYGSGGNRLVFTYGNASANSVLTLVQSTGNVLIGTTMDGGVNRVLSVERSQNAVSSVAMINPNTGNAASAQFIISANNSSGFYGAFSSTHATTNWAGRSVFGTNALGGGITISAHNSGQDIRFLTDSTSNIRMVVASNGNVLINTTDNPGATLHVNGTIRTGAPSGGSAVNWRLGTARGGTVTTNATVRVEIDGVLVDLVARYV